MTRKKVKLVWIVNDAARKASLKKRRIGLLKKVSELTTLCGVSAFAIIYSPEESEPMLWPSRPVVEQMLMRYQSIPEMERSKKMMNQESYLKERMGKIQEQARKISKKNREIEMSCLMDRLHHHGNGADDFELSELQCLIWLIEEKIRDIRKRIDYFQQAPPLNPPGSFLDQPPAPPLPPPPPQGPGLEEMGQEGGGAGGGELRSASTDGMLWDQWLIDMINNSVAGGSGGARNDMMMAPPPPPPPPPQGYNPGGFPGSGFDVGVLGLGHPSGGGNPFDHGMPPHPNPNPFGLGFPHGDFLGSSGGNAMGLGPLPPPNSAIDGPAALDEGLQGFFAAGSDIGLPSLPWPHNFSP